MVKDLIKLTPSIYRNENEARSLELKQIKKLTLKKNKKNLVHLTPQRKAKLK